MFNSYYLSQTKLPDGLLQVDTIIRVLSGETHMEMYPDRAVDCDPLQHGDIMGTSQGVTETVQC